MKKILAIVLVLTFPSMFIHAQNVWEEKAEETNYNNKYLVGAVPVVDGHVIFSQVINCPGKSKSEIFKKVSNFLRLMTKQEGQLEQSRIALLDSVSYIVVGRYEEWLVFTNKALSLDRTRLYYNLVCKCYDGKMDVTMGNIRYLYDEERSAQTYSAEEWITDKFGLTKNQKKLSRISGKFRQKTIDRKNYLFGKLETLLK